MSHMMKTCWIIVFATCVSWCSLALSATSGKTVEEDLSISSQIDSLTAFCSVFDPCAPFTYPDSLRSMSTQTDTTLGIVVGRAVWALAIVEYNSDTVVESANISLINTTPRAQLSQYDALILGCLKRYFDQNIVGSKVRRQALGFVGGRPKSGWVDDRSMKRDSVVVGGDVLFRGVRKGTLLIAIAAGAAPHGGLGLQLVSMISLDLRQ